MNSIPTQLPGVYIIEPKASRDERGEFVKVFHQDTFLQQHFATHFVESYYSTSKKDVIRGMHFQIPPQDHAKLVYVTAGMILDVILDIRKGSSTYGQYITVELSEQNRQLVYIPQGCAHGFLSLKDDTCVTYMQTSMYSPEHDRGIKFDSFGMTWNVEKPIMSQRDVAFPSFTEFTSPFTFDQAITL